jgi:predicted GIY-YIG superfamily endonuclease
MMVPVAASPYVCYLLVSLTSKRTYVGITNNLQRRIRQHNGEIKGGAKATRIGRPHYCRVTVGGFTSQQECLQFEWMWKHMAPRKSHGEKARIVKLKVLLQKDQWTRHAPLACTVPLVVSVYPHPPRQEEEEEESQGAVFEEMRHELPNYITIHIQQQQQQDDNEEEQEETTTTTMSQNEEQTDAT